MKALIESMVPEPTISILAAVAELAVFLFSITGMCALILCLA